MSKPSEFALWAKTYTATRDDHMNGYHGIDHPTAFAHASWEACKARCLEILAAHEEYIDGYNETYIHLDALKDIQAL